MNLKVAQAIAQSLNHPKIIDAIDTYLDDRISDLRLELENTRDDRRMHELQGGIAALKAMYKIREHALATVEVNKNG
jgi:hypothetical protein